MKKFVFAVLSLFIVVLLCFWLFPNDKKLIEEKLISLSELISKPKEQEVLGKALRVKAFKKMLAQEVLIDSLKVPNGIRGKKTRDELAQWLLTAIEYSTMMSLGFGEPHIQTIEAGHAVLELKAETRVDMLTGDNQNETFERLLIEMVKIEGHWLFKGFKELQ